MHDGYPDDPRANPVQNVDFRQVYSVSATLQTRRDVSVFPGTQVEAIPATRITNQPMAARRLRSPCSSPDLFAVDPVQLVVDHLDAGLVAHSDADVGHVIFEGSCCSALETRSHRHDVRQASVAPAGLRCEHGVSRGT